MTSSGMKRGLAVAAISALAVTGLPLTANAAPLSAQAGGDDVVVLYTPHDTGFASFNNDGVNNTVHLLANGGKDVIKVHFEYSIDGGTSWKDIATVSRSNGAFSTEWAPPTAAYNLPTQIRATALGAVSTPIGTPDVNTAVVSGGAESIDIANAPGSAIGVYLNPDGDAFGAVSGTTSDVAADPSITLSSPNSTGAAETEDVAGDVATGATSRSFSGPVNFKGYAWDTDDTDGVVNEALVYAQDQSSDAEAVTLYKQDIKSVSAEAKPATVQGDAKSTGVVTVLDQYGKPVVGAHVYMAGDPDVGPMLTNSKGKAEFENLAGDADGIEYGFYVDENGDGAYNASSEYFRKATVTAYTPKATTLVGDSHDGAAFDFDEYTADNGKGEGDITVTVKDQNGAALKGANLSGKWTVTPFDGSDVQKLDATITDTDNDGIYNVAFPSAKEGKYTLNVWIERDGTPGEGSGDLSMDALQFRAGDAVIKWHDDEVAQRGAGDTSVFKATMMLDDETTLAGRNVDITWTKSTDANGDGTTGDNGNAVVSAQASQPEGTKRTGDATASAVTDKDGSFGVALSDPAATPNVNELGGLLDAFGVNTPSIGNSGAQSDALTVEFLADMAVSDTKSGTSQQNLGGAAAPGRPVRVNITVKNKDGVTLTDLPVKVTTDHGFFSTPDADSLNDLKPAKPASEGALYGEWEDLGTTYNTSTDDYGNAHAVVAIEKDAGFDDDGIVAAHVKFEVGGKIFTEKVVFDSSNPMNPGEVVIQLAPKSQQTVTVLPKAPTTEHVAFDVKATDQFGNRTDVVIDLSDNNADADIVDKYGHDLSSVTSNWEGDTPRVYGAGVTETTQVISGLWDDAVTRTWTDAQTPLPAGFQEEDTNGVDGVKTSTKDLTAEGPAIYWYMIDFAKSMYTIGHTGSDVQPVGDTVTVNYRAVDQNGEPIQGLLVRYFRSGPDDLQDGDGNSYDVTDSDGRATYTYQGAKAGKALTTAIAYRDWDLFEDWSYGTRIAESEQTDKVTFETESKPGPTPIKIDAQLNLHNDRKGNDVAVVKAPAAAKGATIKLYRFARNGKRVLVGTKTAGNFGNARFVKIDRNKRAVTRYQAFVVKTAKTFGDWTVRKGIR